VIKGQLLPPSLLNQLSVMIGPVRLVYRLLEKASFPLGE